MTEEEAKQKWCAHSRVGGLMGSEAQGVTWNRWPQDEEIAVTSRCLGRQCMAWRWRDPGSVRECYGGTMPDNQIQAHPMHGYCGIAGKE